MVDFIPFFFCISSLVGISCVLLTFCETVLFHIANSSAVLEKHGESEYCVCNAL